MAFVSRMAVVSRRALVSRRARATQAVLGSYARARTCSLVSSGRQV